METEKGLVKVQEVKLPAFVENAYQTIEGMKEFANMLLESKLVPDSYYEKGIDNKPDYTKGKTSAVVVVLLQAQQLEISPLTALQDIVPVNGLLSIKGDLAKTMIFASGKLKKDSWKEVVEGTIENENMKVSITAARADNGLTLTRSFSVDDAKRAGLWISKERISGQNGYKYKLSAWYKYPANQLYYRALGFLSRQLFGDVLKNMYTTEEAREIPRETIEVIETSDGNKITLPDKDFAQERSETLTEKATKKIKGQKFEPVQEAQVVESGGKKEQPIVAQRGSVESFQGEVTKVDGEPVKKDEEPQLKEGQLSSEEMDGMETKTLLAIINVDTDMIEAMETIPGKNTHKKLKGIISAHQAGTLDKLIVPYRTQENEKKQDDLEREMSGADGGGMKEETAGQGIKPNLDFDKQGQVLENKAGMFVPEFDKGSERSFGPMKILFNSLASLKPPIDNPRYIELAIAKKCIDKFPDRESFCRYASVNEVNELVNSN